MVPSVKLHKNDGKLLSNPEIYKSIVDKLIYLTVTRPNIAFATQQLSQFMDN